VRGEGGWVRSRNIFTLTTYALRLAAFLPLARFSHQTAGHIQGFLLQLPADLSFLRQKPEDLPVHNEGALSCTADHVDLQVQ